MEVSMATVRLEAGTSGEVMHIHTILRLDVCVI